MSAVKKAPRGRGRPPLKPGSARVVGFTVRISEAERTVIDAAAQRAGEPVTQWARRAILEAAVKG